MITWWFIRCQAGAHYAARNRRKTNHPRVACLVPDT